MALTLKGSAETNGSCLVSSGTGDAHLIGGALGDSFTLLARLTAGVTIDGGAGNDTINLSDDYSGGNAFTFGATSAGPSTHDPNFPEGHPRFELSGLYCL